MATQREARSQTSRNSTVQQTADALGNMLESGANLMGRGMAAGVEGAGALANRAMEMTGLTSPAAAGRTASRVAASTASTGRSMASGATRMATTAERAAERSARPAPRRDAAKKSGGAKKGASAKRSSGTKKTAGRSAKGSSRGGKKRAR